MKRCILLMLIVSCYAYSQEEFKVHTNGLIYDVSTMQKLGAIVDSLNLKFKSCDLPHPYYSYPQGRATFVEVPTKGASKLISSGASLQSYLQQFPKSFQRELWIVKTRYEDYQQNKYIEYSGLHYGHGQEPSVRVKDKGSNDKNTGWIVDEEGKQAFYFQKLEPLPLPFEYARLVQYVDCMIDTTAEIYFPQAKGQVYQRETEGTKAYQFVKWAEDFPGRPAYPEYNDKTSDEEFTKAYQVFSKRHNTWDSLRLLSLDDKMSNSIYWSSLLADAVDESLENGNSGAQFEFYVSRYLSKESALKLMRSRKVVGNCSQDQSPRYHAMNICQLAAETAQWDIFLRSHLDIMNDRFERMSDGNYAWGGRRTYLKELEELDIPAVDLLVGTCLRVSNVSPNHYWGSINRVGRALADTSDKDKLEEKLFSMMADSGLDPFNRLLIAYLFDNYSHNLDDDARKLVNKQKLDQAINQMPDYIKSVWSKE